MAELNRAIAAKLWQEMTIELDRFHAKIVRHEKSVFLGYADLTLTIPNLPGFALKLRGLDVKMLKGNPHIDFPSERGADGNFYPHFFPKSNEMRQVLTTAIFSDERVAATVESAAQAPEPSTEESEGAVANTGDNPFTGASS